MSLQPRYLPLLALIPLAGGTNLIVTAITLAFCALVLLTLCSLLLAATHRIVEPDYQPVAALLLGIGLIGLLELFVQLLSAELFVALAPVLPLLILPCLSLRPTVLSGLRAGLGIAGLALCLGLLREPLGHASLFAHLDWLLGPQASNWSVTFSGFSGVPLLILAPGALLILGLLWGAGRYFLNLTSAHERRKTP